MCSTKYDFNIPELLCPKPPDHYSGHMTLHFPCISKYLEKFTILTDQIIHLKMSLYASVCNNTVMMWHLFIELIVSFCIKITQGKFM